MIIEVNDVSDLNRHNFGGSQEEFMVLGDETLRPHRQLGIPPTTVLSSLLCIARKPTAGFPCQESHAGPKRLVAVVAHPLRRPQAFGRSHGVQGACPCEPAQARGATQAQGVRGFCPKRFPEPPPSSATAFHCSPRKSAFSLLAEGYWEYSSIDNCCEKKPSPYGTPH